MELALTVTFVTAFCDRQEMQYVWERCGLQRGLTSPLYFLCALPLSLQNWDRTYFLLKTCQNTINILLKALWIKLIQSTFKSHLNDKNRPKTGWLKNNVRFEHRLVLQTIQQATQLIQSNLIWINHINSMQVHTNKIQPWLYASFSQVCEYCYFPLTFLIWFILTRTPWPRSLRIISFSASLNW